MTDLTAYAEWLGIASWVSAQGITTQGSTCVVRPRRETRAQDSFPVEVGFWAEQPSAQTYQKLEQASAFVGFFANEFRPEVAHGENCTTATMTLGAFADDPRSAELAPFVTIDHSARNHDTTYGLDQCVAWAAELAWLRDWIPPGDPYLFAFGIMRMVHRYRMQARPQGMFFVQYPCRGDEPQLTFIAHQDDPTYTARVLGDLVAECHEWAAAFGGQLPPITVEIGAGSIEYFHDPDVAFEPIFFAGEPFLDQEYLDIPGELIELGSSNPPRELPAASPVQPAVSGSARGILCSSEVFGKNFVPQELGPHVRWFANQHYQVTNPVPAQVLACAVRADLGTVRCWVSVFDDETYGWLAAWLGAKGEFTSEVVVGSPDDDPEITNYRPFMVLDRTASQDQYPLVALVESVKGLTAERVVPSAVSPRTRVRKALQLAALGDPVANRAWVGFEVTDELVRVHVADHHGVWTCAAVAVFEHRCRELVHSAMGTAVRCELVQHGLAPLSAQPGRIETYSGYHPELDGYGETVVVQQP